MPDLFSGHQIREHFRQLEALDRRLERWGWFRRGSGRQGSSGWRYRAGAVLVRLGGWLQGEGASKRAAVDSESAASGEAG